MLHAITALTTGVELVTELLSAAVLLMALDKLAAAIRWIYKAGRFADQVMACALASENEQRLREFPLTAECLQGRGAEVWRSERVSLGLING